MCHMKLSPREEYLSDIAARSTSVAERLAGVTTSVTPADASGIANRLDAWRESAAEGAGDRFQRRLAWDGLDTDSVAPLLGAVQWRNGASLPEWTHTLSATLDEAAQQSFEANSHAFFDSESPLPFQDVLAPFVLVARRRYRAQVGDAGSVLSPRACATLERHLLKVLVTYAAQVLQLEFTVARARQQSALEQLFARAPDLEDRTLYRRFVEDLWRGGLATLFGEYTVLARLLSTIALCWVEANAEFVLRLFSDRAALRALLGVADGLGPVIAIEPSLSDPHCGRRSVLALTFQNSVKVIYKPRSLGVDTAYIAALSWLNAHQAPLPFKLLSLIDRGSYGWVEYVEHSPCLNEDEARLYFRRAGMLLCVVYALEGTDCHYQNVIAHGEHPVLIDMEALLHPRDDLEGEYPGNQPPSLANQRMEHSVLYTGLLPSWSTQADHAVAYDTSGYGSIGGQAVPSQLLSCEHVNTDRMALTERPSEIAGNGNVPSFGGNPLSLQNYPTEVIEGFRAMYRCLLANREAFLAPDGPLHALVHQSVRFLFRSTDIYWTVLLSMLNPRYLRDGADQSIHCELLCRVLSSNASRPRHWPLLAREEQALQSADIPFFTVQADAASLSRLRGLSAEDEERQAEFIRGALYAYTARDTVCEGSPDPSPADAILPPDALIAQAVAIAEAIAARAIHAPDGGIGWIAPQYQARVRRYQFRPIGYNLYDGGSGIALFFAALEKVLANGRYRDAALGALQPLRRALGTSAGSVASEIGIGGAMGLGSVVYALTRISQFLNDPALLEDAERAAALITPGLIAADGNVDVMSGAAGAILGLLSLHGVTSSPLALERARDCARHLSSARVAAVSLTGFSHGAAGIAYALLRLFAVTGETRLLEVAVEAIAYEGRVFDSKAGNWPDYRQDPQPAFMRSWCAGAPGIGLARFGGSSICHSPQIAHDIEVALQTTLNAGLGSIDNLCCGNMGRVEFLLTANLVNAAQRLATQSVNRAIGTNGYVLHQSIPREGYNPSLFSGTAGIGYELLRLTGPNTFPSLLLWQ